MTTKPQHSSNIPQSKSSSAPQNAPAHTTTQNGDPSATGPSVFKVPPRANINPETDRRYDDDGTGFGPAASAVEF